jgi:hypothetical protein
MPWLDPVVCFRRAGVDHHVGQQVARPPALITQWSATPPSTAQAHPGGAGQAVASGLVDRLVEGLHGQMTIRTVWELDGQLVADLLRTMTLTQAAVDELPQHWIGRDPGRFGPAATGHREPVRGVRQVSATGPGRGSVVVRD